MRMYFFELKKLFSKKFVLVFACLLLCVDIAVSLYYALDKDKEIRISQDTLEEAIELYKNDKNAFDAELMRLSSLQSQYYKLKNTALSTGEPFDEQEAQAVFERFYAYQTAFSYRYYTNVYKEDIQTFITAAKKNIAEYNSTNIPKDSFLYMNQEQIINFYTQTAKIELSFEPYRGWDIYFKMFVPNILILVLLIIFVPVISLADDNAGLSLIICSTKKGRFSLFKTKTFSVITITSITVLLFSLVPLAVIALTKGLSATGCYIQSIEILKLCPFTASILKILIYSLLIKLLVFNAVAILILLFSELFRKFQYAFGFSLLFFALEYVLYRTEFLMPNNFFSVTNIFYATNASELFERFYGVNLFDRSVFHFYILTVLYCAVLLLSFALGSFLSVKSSFRLKILQKNESKNPLGVLKEKILSFRLFKPHYSLTGFELYKTLIAKSFLIFIILLTALKLFMSYKTNEFIPSSEENFYKRYLTVLQGEINDEKRNYIASERQELNNILSSFSQYNGLYKNGSITSEEYNKYLNKYYSAITKGKALARVEKYAGYLNQREAQGVNALFVYDTGWNTLFDADFDYILFFLILLIVSGVFADEYRQGIIPVIKSTKKGRNECFYAKLRVCMGVSLFLLLSYNLIDAFFFTKFYTLPFSSAPLASLQIFEGTKAELVNMELWKFFALGVVIRYISYIIVVYLIFSLSQLLKQIISIIGVLCLFVYLPFALEKFGFTPAGYLSYADLLSGNRYFIISSGVGILSDVGMAVSFISFTAVVTAFLYKSAKRRYVL